jgi:serine/threonine protein kinase
VWSYLGVELRSKMSATAEQLTGVDFRVGDSLSETADYPPKRSSESGPDDPMGTLDMPKASSSSQPLGRFTFSSGARPLDGYTIKRAIGRGGFGEVYYATSDSGKEVALKLILHNLEVERRGVMQCMNLKCPNLLTIFDLKTTSAGDTFVVMEYVAGVSLTTTLKQYPSGLPPTEVRHWLKGLVEGVAYLHDHGIVHRDLKPANLFMEEGIVKIGDYGLAKLITPSQSTEHSESIGTCHYMAPEIGSGKYNKPIDVYAIGVILYEMITGRVPFEGETVNEVLMKHLTARPDVSILPEPYRTIVAKALAKDPNHRPTRLYDLLPPEDAPQAPEVRIIGEGKSSAPAAVCDGGSGVVGTMQDEVLRIEAEEPVFYIGPDTKPPRAPNQLQNAIGARLRANWEALRRPERYQPQPPRVRRITKATPDGSRNAEVRQAPYSPAQSPRLRRTTMRPESPPPEPPSLPSGRIRFAELAASMLWAAPLLVLLTAPGTAILGIDPSINPQHVAYLYGMSLLGTWITLIPNKVLETRALESGPRRLIALASGLLVGVISIAMARLLHLGFTESHEFFGAPLEIVYFGALYALTSGWWSVARRDRPARFRFWPIVGTTLFSALLVPLWPYRRADGIAIAVSIATAVQLVSPWSKSASVYARSVRTSEKQRRA